MTPIKPVVQTQSSPPHLRIFIDPSKSNDTPVFVWQQIEESVASDSIVLSGQIAKRVLWLLEMYKNKVPDPGWGGDLREPNCHSAAMYAAGLINDPAPSGNFARTYSGLEEVLTYDKPQPPAVVHLLTARIPPRAIHEAGTIHEADGPICPHTTLYVGDLRGRMVCFQKHGDGTTGIDFLRNAERRYGTTHRLYVNAEYRL